MKRSPNKYSPDKVHSNFGINNWFASKGLCDHNEIRQIKYDFCIENGFELISGTLSKKEKDKINSFIQNRFTKFCQFASKVIRQCEQASKA